MSIRDKLYGFIMAVIKSEQFENRRRYERKDFLQAV